MDDLKNFVKVEMVQAFTPQQIVDLMDKMEKETNDLKQAHVLIIREVKFSTKSRINILNDIYDISKKALKK